MTAPLGRLISSAKEPGRMLLTMTPPLTPSLDARAEGMAETVMPSLPSLASGWGGAAFSLPELLVSSASWARSPVGGEVPRGGAVGVAEVAQLHGRADLARGDVGDQLVTVLDGLAIDGEDDVPGLDAGLGGALAGGDGVDQDAAVGKAVFAADRSGQGTLEADANGAPHDLVLRPDEHVVDIDDDVGGHGEADALRAHGLGVDGGVHADDLDRK